MLLPINGKKGEEAIQVLRWNNLKDIMSVENARCRITYCATICGEKERGGDESHSRVKKQKKKKGRGGRVENLLPYPPRCLPGHSLSLKRHTGSWRPWLPPRRGAWVSGNRKDLALCILVYL